VIAPAWCGQFTRLQYADKGRGPVEFDCWGFVRQVERVQFGESDLPDLREEYASSEDHLAVAATVNFWESALSLLWRRVEAPQAGDVVILKIAGRPWHCGVCVGGELFMHMQKGVNVALERFTNDVWRNRVEGFYRHV
jgi:cell wall-associated NlpC family hydrolase